VTIGQITQTQDNITMANESAALQYLRTRNDELEQENKFLKMELEEAQYLAQTTFSFIKEIED